MNLDSGEENAGGMADRTRSCTQHLTDEEERTERLRVYVMMEQESTGSGGVGPGAMVAPREPLNVIPTILRTLPTPPRVTPVVRDNASRDDVAGNKGDAGDHDGNGEHHQHTGTSS